ncbi:MAG TPA: class I SAM-dependent methyltransferase [Ktedonobacteraceae bacterium]|nr:class I SAM-dependent methyltransferase [Ktedonobacteraceae bacterium]
MIHPHSTSLIVFVEERELARQLEVTRFLLEEMGGSLPREQIVTKQLTSVLDVACGAGGWALDAAERYPMLQVTGIDHRESQVAYAQRRANGRGLVNAHFLVQDRQSLEANTFASTPFDLINVAFIAPTLLETDYAALMQTLCALCRPGGIIRWTEMELPVTNSPAFERLMALVCQALEVAGHTFTSPAMREIADVFAALRRETGRVVMPTPRRHLGITPMMGNWLRHAGCWTVESFPLAIEVASDRHALPLFLSQVEVFTQQIAPWLCAQHVTTSDVLASLLAQVMQELQDEDFCGLCWLLTVYGYKAA